MRRYIIREYTKFYNAPGESEMPPLAEQFELDAAEIGLPLHSWRYSETTDNGKILQSIVAVFLVPDGAESKAEKIGRQYPADCPRCRHLPAD